MTKDRENAHALLEAVYASLDFDGGDLLNATDSPGKLARDKWITRGGWLSLARKINADRVFFVEDNPVIVFVKDEPGEADLRRVFNRAWCMARPLLLFVAQPGTLSVFDLTQPPVGKNDDPSASGRLLKVASQTAEIQCKLKDYHRARIESGRLFEEHRFGLENRADRALIRDLAVVRAKLLKSGLSIEHAHALIARSIFIRYLEDRRILTRDYFRKLTRGNKGWRGILDNAAKHDGAKDERRLYYAAVLSDEGFTHALFSRLADEFNGDLFPFDADEQKAFTAPRLNLMRSFLLGQIEGPTLLTFAYDFDIIPIDLISSMYEEFLRAEKGKPNTYGSFYTPGALVEFVLSQTLEDKVLDRRPRIVDPACGSAIFLVEAFRCLIRHRTYERGQRLRPDEVRKILREQIAGIDVQPEAIRVAAFSLYLALLHYLDPPDILGQRLPNLIYSAKREATDSIQHYDILVPANAFDVEAAVQEEPIRRRFSSECADVVVGNPPWGTPSGQDDETRKAASMAMKWCHHREKVVGDKELSQAFIYRSQDLLRDGGRAGLLVSTGVFFKRHDNSRRFRQQWLASSTLEAVVNFAAVRDVFFMKAIAPFASVVFDKRSPRRGRHRFRYYSAKRTALVEGLQIVSLSKPDLHMVQQSAVVADEELWKVYWWGGHRDLALVQALRMEHRLGSLIDPDGTHPGRMGEGFKVTKKERKPIQWLRQFREFPTRYFERYGQLPSDQLVHPPREVERARTRDLFEGRRLLVKRGLTQKEGEDGRIVARLETDPFCFRHSIHCFKLDHVDEDVAKTVLGILWSSVARYYLWMTSGSWGMWHHELRIDSIKRLPIRVPSNRDLRTRICRIVDRLRSIDTTAGDMLSAGGMRSKPPGDPEVRRLEAELDGAVFDLYEFTAAERDVVGDMCAVGLELFYRGTKSEALKPISGLADRPRVGRRSDLTRKRSTQRGLDGYLDAFLEIWDAELGPGGQLRWRIILPSDPSPMLAVVFSTEYTDSPLPAAADSDDAAWSKLLHKMVQPSSHMFGSTRIYIDGMARIVRENDIAIIKRNERRLWTRTAAREDAEAIQLIAVHKQRALTREREI